MTRRLLASTNRILQLPVTLDNLLTPLEEDLALVGEPPRSLRPVDQLGAQLLLDLSNGLTGCGLADGAGDRATRKALMADHVTENAQRLKMHGTDTLSHFS